MYFDIGANIGEWTKQNILSASKIIAVEASPTTYLKLVNKVNTFDKNNKITCINIAVCDNNNEPTTFCNCNTDTVSTLNKKWLTDQKSRFCNIDKFEEITVNTMTIDKMISIYGEPDLIKIDVEGGEYQCVKSLTKKVSNLCFEWASEMNDVSFDCLDHLQTLGFYHFEIQFQDNYTYRPLNFNKSIDDIKHMLSQTTPKVEWGMIWCK